MMRRLIPGIFHVACSGDADFRVSSVAGGYMIGEPRGDRMRACMRSGPSSSPG